MMAVQQGGSWIIRYKIDFHATEPRHVDRVFHDARGGLVTDLRYLECVPVKMNRVIVTAHVCHNEPVPLACPWRIRKSSRKRLLATWQRRFLAVRYYH